MADIGDGAHDYWRVMEMCGEHFVFEFRREAEFSFAVFCLKFPTMPTSIENLDLRMEHDGRLRYPAGMRFVSRFSADLAATEWMYWYLHQRRVVMT